MIKFKRRKLRCWIGTEGYLDDHQSEPADLLFKTEQDLLDWIEQSLEYHSGHFKLTIDGNSVIWGVVLGWIESVEAATEFNVVAEKARIDREMAALQSQLDKLQLEICKHSNVSKMPRANTGNWDRNDDRYWYEFRCPDCGLFWTEEQ